MVPRTVLKRETRREGFRQAHELDAMVANTELTLISVGQGVALYFLADNAKSVLGTPLWDLFPRVASAFLIVAIVWSRSLIHAFTTIRWPLNLVHTWLYFGVTVVQASLCAQLAEPVRWWGLSTVLAVFVWVMFVVERRLYVDRRADSSGPVGKQLLDLLEAEHVLNLRVLAPGMVVAFGGVFAARVKWPDQLAPWSLGLDLVQALVLLGYLVHVFLLYRRSRVLIVEARTEWQG